MKVMINVEVLPETLGGPVDHVNAVLSDFAVFLEENSGRYDVAYGTGWGTGFAILDVDAFEDAWELVMRSPAYQHTRVEILALADPIRLTRALVEKSVVPFGEQLAKETREVRADG